MNKLFCTLTRMRRSLRMSELPQVGMRGASKEGARGMSRKEVQATVEGNPERPPSDESVCSS